MVITSEFCMSCIETTIGMMHSYLLIIIICFISTISTTMAKETKVTKKLNSRPPPAKLDWDYLSGFEPFRRRLRIFFTFFSPPVVVEYNHIFILVSVGIHTPELPSVEWMDDDVQSEVKSEFTSFGNVSKNLLAHYHHLCTLEDAEIMPVIFWINIASIFMVLSR